MASAGAGVGASPGSHVAFSHVHLYADALQPLEEYKALEAKLNDFAARLPVTPSVSEGRETWLKLSEVHGDPGVTKHGGSGQWSPAGQDVVEQLLVGLGWRVTGICNSSSTCSLVVTSPDPKGVKFVVTAHRDHSIAELALRESAPAKSNKQEHWEHFSPSQLVRFSEHQSGREGVAVLGFSVQPGCLEAIQAKYEKLHPSLLLPGSPHHYDGTKLLEVYAYYLDDTPSSGADKGTVLRFLEEPTSGAPDHWVLPGMERVAASFDGRTLPAYCDHWVSNVVSRTGFLDTLHDTLGFTPKVDFNAGVVAAGEAQIESTVTGNDPGLHTSDRSLALRDQSQVYLPINNALSEVGHVHLYLQEIGQGVQHIASRVADLPSVVQHANDFREMTGAGLSFLAIPRSYYGSLSAGQLSRDAQLELPLAEECLSSLQAAGIVDTGGIVDLGASREAVTEALPPAAPASVVEHVLRGRYRNLYALAGEALKEEEYLKVVRNNILLDVQGGDLLMQIFTCNVLQRIDGEEAPFLEFIQRICSPHAIGSTGQLRQVRPGCGGFGIRNFLTLFLSIEVSKATKLRLEAESVGDLEAAEHFRSMTDLFTAQLEESNPILTAISDAMTAEGDAREEGDAAAVDHHRSAKLAGQESLKHISRKYSDLMYELRRSREEVPVA